MSKERGREFNNSAGLAGVVRASDSLPYDRREYAICFVFVLDYSDEATDAHEMHTFHDLLVNSRIRRPSASVHSFDYR